MGVYFCVSMAFLWVVLVKTHVTGPRHCIRVNAIVIIILPSAFDQTLVFQTLIKFWRHNKLNLAATVLLPNPCALHKKYQVGCNVLVFEELPSSSCLRANMGCALTSEFFRSAPSTFPQRRDYLLGASFRESLVIRLYSEIGQIHLSIEAQYDHLFY